MSITDPSDISGLIHRWRPYAGAWQDAAGTIAAGVGDPIGRLDDLLGAANASQANTLKKPTLREDANGWRYADSDGVDDVLAGSMPTIGSNWSIAMVFRFSSVAASRQYLVSLGPVGASRVYGFLLGTNSNRFRVNVGDGATYAEVSMTSLTPAVDTLYALVATHTAGGQLALNINGTRQTTAGLASTYAATDLYIGGSLSEIASWDSGNSEILDFMIFDNAIGLSAETDLRTYLSALYSSPPPAAGISPAIIRHRLQMMGAY